MRAMTASLLIGLIFSAQSNIYSQTRSDFVSDASHIVGTYQPLVTDHSPAAMAKAANQFLASLDGSQRKKATGPLTGEIRREWTNLPARANADGIRMGELKPRQVKAACHMMATVLSQQGYNKVVHIMLADDQLLSKGRPRPGFGTENFSLVVFGNPDASDSWALQIDGHHVGLNVSIDGKQMTLSPSFIGTQPDAFQIGTTRFRPFAGESDLGYQLAASLDFDQLQTAIVSDRRGRIQTGPGNDGKIPKPNGVPCSTFTQSQRKLLLDLVAQWVNDLPKSQAAKRMSELEKEIDNMRFAWSGEKVKSKGIKTDISYVLQGPSIIIEYACQDLGGNPLDHLHSVYRNPKNEYGGQLKAKQE